MAGRVVYEGRLPIALAGFDAGRAKVIVREGDSVHPPATATTRCSSSPKRTTRGDRYSVTSSQGGVPEVLERLKAQIEKNIQT
jgi:hypothetical protein